MRKLTVVGTGSTQGNCYILDCDGEKLILDAGVRIGEIKKALYWSIMDVKGVLITHGHRDHALSEESLRFMGIPVIAPYHGNLMEKSARLGGYRVYAFDVPHNGVPNYGFLIHHGEWKMVYLTDMEFSPYSFTKQRLNAILVECNYTQANREASNYVHVVLGHASLEVTKEFTKINATDNLRNVILCHLSEVNADPDLIMTEISSVVPPMTQVDMAEKGKTIEL